MKIESTHHDLKIYRLSITEWDKLQCDKMQHKRQQLSAHSKLQSNGGAALLSSQHN